MRAWSYTTNAVLCMSPPPPGSQTGGLHCWGLSIWQRPGGEEVLTAYSARMRHALSWEA